MTPDEHTNQEFFLDVGNGHQIYVQDWGKQDAKTPILSIHGGPGSGSDNRDKLKFDPKTQRVIFHDQRGGGKNSPTESLTNNTSQDLIEDIHKIVQRLELDKFILTGGSWGSTLSLLYGIAYPEQVTGMVLDGIYTATQEENDWINTGGWQKFFPEIWDKYVATVPGTYHKNPSEYHFKQAASGDPEAAKKAAYAFSSMELALLKLDDIYSPDDYDKFDPAANLIEIHYLSNNCFLSKNFILQNAAKLKMPIHIIQGRYDIVCPPSTAYKLNRALPNSDITWTINGHLRQHEAKNIQNLLIKQLTQEK